MFGQGFPCILGNVNSSTEKLLFAVCSSPMRKNLPFFLCSKKLGSLASETSTIRTQHSAVTLSKKKKAKENSRHYCTAQSPMGEADINFLLPYLCAENHCYYYGLNPSSYLDQVTGGESLAQRWDITSAIYIHNLFSR